MTPARRAELQRVIDADPRTVGVFTANWTTRLLAEYLAQVTGIRVGRETLRRHGYVCKRPWATGPPRVPTIVTILS